MLQKTKFSDEFPSPEDEFVTHGKQYTVVTADKAAYLKTAYQQYPGKKVWMPLLMESANSQQAIVGTWLKYHEMTNTVLFTHSEVIIETLKKGIDDDQSCRLNHDDLCVNLITDDEEGLYIIPLSFNEIGECVNVQPYHLGDWRWK